LAIQQPGRNRLTIYA